MSRYTGQQKEAAELAVSLLRLGPLSNINESITNAAALCPGIDELLRSRSQGLPQLLVDPLVCKYFIACPFNKTENSFRSPWTGNWLPPIAESLKPAPHLRQLEEQFNAAYDAYRDA
ncbi:f-actin capping protein beta subunit, putative [Eimeria acervulina]|uniref:F-actin-capping protein subunit beta n=1 Tax=Eimeria acervulina TaxID=5801 RepID=U6GMU2_EIMAC|nr:f-actin capping protein beta subunit, putative [Eimeria acervulina]CDI80583.1 f-actin capping protein beta subunit, putative [Eimeria acervulina]